MGTKSPAEFARCRDLNDLVLVALTGYGQEEDRRMAFEAGFNHHLVKPVSIDALEQLLAGIAGRRGGATT